MGIHPDLKNLTIHDFFFCHRSSGLDQSVSLKGSWPLPRGEGLAKRIAKRFMPSWNNRAWRLARTIRKIRPDIVHSFYTQLSGYLTLDARTHFDSDFPIWIHSSWGQDFFFIGQKPGHKERTQAVLAACDYFIADCQRDVRLAEEFGFKKEVLGVFPAPGGYGIQRMQKFRDPSPVSSRKVIALKGYHNDEWTGRALVALQAMHMCADSLVGYEVVIYQADTNVQYAAEYLARITGLSISILPPSPHDELLRLIGRARIAIGVCVSDGTPNAMLEAMVMGAFPIQSDTISTAEWINNGENGLLVPPEEPEAIAAAMRRALFDDALVDRAAEINERITAERIDRAVIQPQVIALYEKVGMQRKLHLMRQ
jgi:hypothetical protein